MFPPGPQQAPTPRLSAIGTGGPPATSTRRSFPPAKKPIDRLSGDQKGSTLFSDPATKVVAADSSERNQSPRRPLASTPAMARRRPSGETAAEPKLTLSGRRT